MKTHECKYDLDGGGCRVCGQTVSEQLVGMSETKTPLSDSVAHWCPECGPSHRSMDVVPLERSRAIEQRLNECVEALEHVLSVIPPQSLPHSRKLMQTAITNARRPLGQKESAWVCQHCGHEWDDGNKPYCSCGGPYRIPNPQQNAE